MIMAVVEIPTERPLTLKQEACPLGIQATPSSIPTSGTSFAGGLVMRKFLRLFFLFC